MNFDIPELFGGIIYWYLTQDIVHNEEWFYWNCDFKWTYVQHMKFGQMN